ncbi:hypothetical protein QYE76_063032 [Lolium multiflorum]|uniref:Uncharacterized protein n=1 Tax=Lolium multiflorum TaxID=4521 RepID=A0AAD8W8Y5_LOLMU|nr:hypothetical protein QYE76_063032 [Lolium multiflorum]
MDRVGQNRGPKPRCIPKADGRGIRDNPNLAQIWSRFAWLRMAHILTCPPARLPGPPVGGRVKLNVEGEGDCPYPVPTPDSTPHARSSSSFRAAIAPKREFEPSTNDHEAGSSRRAVPTALDMGPLMRDRIYGIVVVQIFWEAGAPMSWGDVHLPHGWQPSPDKVQVPPIPPPAVPTWRRSSGGARSGRRTSGRTPPTATQVPTGTCAPQAQPEKDGDPELRAALAASREVNDLEELAKWLHLAEVLRASALEEWARKAKEDVDAWAFLAMARRQEEAMRQATLWEEEEHLAALRHEAEVQAAMVEQLQKEAARLARLRRPVSPPNPHSAWERA